MQDFKITKREVLVSVIIVAVMLLIGIVIHSGINDALMLKYQKYNTALQIENDSDLFVYGMKTNIGNAFVYGDLKAVDPVTYDEIDGEYSYVEKVTERYTRHIRTITYTDNNGKTKTKTEEYWTWDVIHRESKQSTKITFLDVEFDYGTIEFPYFSHIDTQRESYYIRYKYYGSPSECVGTLYAVLNNDTINEADFYNNYTINETLDSLKTGWQLVLFWVIWILLIGGCVFGFYYIDNKWLEDKRR